MTLGQVAWAVSVMKECGLDATAADEVGLMRAKKFYRSLGWRENHDFYILGGKVYFDVDWPRVGK
jgi:hypothetical protein